MHLPVRPTRLRQRAPFALRQPLLAGLVGAALTFAAFPTLAASETEPNNTFPGQAATVGTTYTGVLCPQNCFGAPIDALDLFHYTGLTPGLAFDLTGTNNAFSNVPDFTFGLYSDQTTIVDSITAFNRLDVVHLTGIVGLSGELTFGVTATTIAAFEGYSLVLNTRPIGVPEPASVALVAAGLAGALVARRRKRP